MTFSAQQLRDIVHGTGEYKVQGIQEAMRFCTHLAKSHYENFPVGSLLVPRNKRSLVHAAYAFARIGDDIADEDNGLSPDERIFLLKSMERSLKEDVYTSSPIFIAIHHVMRELNIPAELPARLLVAFRKDAAFQQPQSFQDIESYCHYSANPVGELVLAVFSERNANTIRYSNAVCTALQMTNFWQDLSRDIPRSRVYIPAQVLNKHNVTIQDLYSDSKNTSISHVMEELIAETKTHFELGKNLLDFVTSKRLRWELAFTIAGAETVLDGVENIASKILYTRPSLSAKHSLSILRRTLSLV